MRVPLAYWSRKRATGSATSQRVTKERPLTVQTIRAGGSSLKTKAADILHGLHSASHLHRGLPLRIVRSIRARHKRASAAILLRRSYWRSLLFWVVLSVSCLLECASAVPRPSDAPHLIKSWRTIDGLPQNSVQAIAQTADGYLWVGTRGGLARFDGVRFTTFGLADGLKGVGITQLLDDGEGGLWIATIGGGLSRWKNGKISTLTTADGLAHNDVMALALAEGGGLWVGTKSGLQLWSAGKFERIGEAEGLGSEVVALATDHEGGLWVSMAGKGMFYCRAGFCEPIEGPPKHRLILGHSLLVDADAALWVSIGNGIVLRRHAGEWTEFNMSHGLPSSFIYCLAPGTDGELWAGSQQEGLYVFREGRFHLVDGHDEAIRAIHVSGDGLVWVGSASGGLSRLMPRKLASYPVGLESRRGQVNGLVEDPSGQFWIATYGGGLHRGHLDQLEPVRELHALNERQHLTAGLRMSDGTIYVAGITLLLRSDSQTGELSAITSVGNVLSLCEGQGGSLWVGTREGELKYLQDNLLQTVRNGTFGAPVCGLLRAPDGALWVATRGAGLFRWNNGRTQRWTTKEGLPTNMIRTTYQDPEGTLWVGTAGGGLSWLQDGRVFTVNSRHGMGDDYISQILEDDYGNLWLGCHRGIFRVSKDELRAVGTGHAAAVHPLALDESDGMLDAECTGGYSPAGLRSSSGTLYFSTVRGVIAVDPTLFGAAAPPPGVHIEEIRLDGKPPAFSDGVFRVPSDTREIEIRYTAFNYKKPAEIRFHHRLGKAEADWVDVGRQRSARFSQLPPGDYFFQVRAANQDGYWSQKGASFAFTVVPFFWQTTWFRTAIVLVLLAVGAGTVLGWARARIRHAQERERLARAEAAAQQRLNELAHVMRVSMLGELSGSIAHELNQPLTAILSNAQAAQRYLAKENANLDEVREILTDIVSEDERAGEVIKRLRLLMRKGQVQQQPIELNEVVVDVLKLVRADLASHHVGVETALTSSLVRVCGDRVQLQQVLLNLVMNACDAMAENEPGDRRLTLRTFPIAGAGVRIEVSDLGHGLPEGGAERAFERYFTTKPQGLGLGLSVCRTILAAHGGSLSAMNNEGRGATFYCVLPLAEEPCS